MQDGPMIIVEYRKTRSLVASQHNARTHSRAQIDQIKSSMSAYGNVNPVLIDENKVIIAGHGRLQAALELKLPEVPTIMLRHLSDVQKRALMLADNKIALNAGGISSRCVPSCR